MTSTAMTKMDLEQLLRQACKDVGHIGAVELPTGVARRFAELVLRKVQGEPTDLVEFAPWLHAAYDRPPQTPEIVAMLAKLDAALAN